MSLIYDKIAAGTLKSYQDFRTGHVLDLSGTGNDGTIGTKVSFLRDGIQTLDTGTGIALGTDSSLSFTEDFSVVAKLRTSDVSGSIFSKYNTSGNQRSYSYELTSGIPRLLLSSDGSATESEIATIAINDGQDHVVGMSYDSTADSVSFYLEGVLDVTKSYSTVLSVFNSTAGVRIADTEAGGTSSIAAIMSYVLSFSEKLSLSDHAQLITELDRIWPTKKFSRDKDVSPNPPKCWHTDWGAYESVVNETSGYLNGTPFQIDSGTFKISTDTIRGNTVKVIECINAGRLYINVDEFNSTRAQAAYGTWDFWFNKGADGTALRMLFVADIIGPVGAVGQDGYEFVFNATERIVCNETTNGSTSVKLQTAVDYLSINTWYNGKITRAAGGVTTFYIDGTAVDVTGGSGTNPFTDNTVTTSNYIVIDLDGGDKIGYGGLSGRYSFLKALEVV